MEAIFTDIFRRRGMQPTHLQEEGDTAYTSSGRGGYSLHIWSR
jgi:hypothetical protein